jgi:hypothetical protein
MDVISPLLTLNPTPIAIDEHRAVFSGPWLPVSIPASWIDDGTAADWALGMEQLPILQRVRLGLQGKRHVGTWALVDRNSRGGAIDGEVMAALTAWAAREQVLAGMGREQNGLIVDIADDASRRRLRRSAERARSETELVFEALLWPRWAGPVILRSATPDPEEAGGETLRPALPILVVDTGKGERRPDLAVAWCRLILERSVPPEGGWPAWLQLGLEGVCAARSIGRPPSPMKMQQLRRAAGINALRACFSDAEPKEDLAVAIATLVASGRRRQHLPSLLDLLRNGVAGEEALRIAYGLSIDDLINRR